MRVLFKRSTNVTGCDSTRSSASIAMSSFLRLSWDVLARLRRLDFLYEKTPPRLLGTISMCFKPTCAVFDGHEFRIECSKLSALFSEAVKVSITIQHGQSTRAADHRRSSIMSVSFLFPRGNQLDVLPLGSLIPNLQPLWQWKALGSHLQLDLSALSEEIFPRLCRVEKVLYKFLK